MDSSSGAPPDGSSGGRPDGPAVVMEIVQVCCTISK